MKSLTLFIALFAIALIMGCGGSSGGSANLGDTVAPSAPANLTATATSSTQINLSWNASTDNVAVSGYRVYRDGTQIATASATTYSDTGLAAETTYGYKVLAYDSATNVSAFSNIVNATTLSASTGGTGGTGDTGGGTGGGATADTVAPSVPSVLTATALSSSEVDLSWIASTDNVGVTGYKIYRNNSLLTSVTVTSFSNTGLTASTTYTYKVAAYDAAGNASAQSSSANATTQTQTSTPNIATLPFNDDFSGDLSKWTTWGDPLPEIDSLSGNSLPSFNPHGDGNYDSGVSSNDVFDFSNGIVMEADLVHPVTET